MNLFSFFNIFQQLNNQKNTFKITFLKNKTYLNIQKINLSLYYKGVPSCVLKRYSK